MISSDLACPTLDAATRGLEVLLHPAPVLVLTVVGAVYGGVNLSWEAVMEVFLIGLALIAGAGIVFLLFVVEPRRTIYDYDPLDPR